MTDSPVTRVLLAAVRTYKRVENGKVETVRAHQDSRRPGMDPRGFGYIPEADWLKGQQEYIKKGEAIYKANEWKAHHGAAKPVAKLGPTGAVRPVSAKPDVDAKTGVAKLGPTGATKPGESGVASRAAARIKEAAAGGEAATGAPSVSTVHGHKVRAVYTHPKSKAVLYDLGNGLHAEGKPGEKPGPVQTSATGLVPEELAEKGWSRAVPKQAPTRPVGERRPEGMVQALKDEQQSYRSHLDKNPLFNTGSAGSEGAAEHAVYGSAAKSGIFSDTDLGQIREQIAGLQQQLKGTSERVQGAHVWAQNAQAKAEEAQSKAEEAHQKIREAAEERKQEKRQRNDARAKLAVELAFTVGTLLFGALSGGGVTLVVGIAMAVQSLPDVGKSLATYHLAEKDTGLQRLLAHPIHHSILGVKAIKAHRGKAAAGASLRRFVKEVRATAFIAGETLALSRVSEARNQTAKVMRIALITHGMTAEGASMVAEAAADHAQKECLKRLAERTLPGPKRG